MKIQTKKTENSRYTFWMNMKIGLTNQANKESLKDHKKTI